MAIGQILVLSATDAVVEGYTQLLGDVLEVVCLIPGGLGREQLADTIAEIRPNIILVDVFQLVERDEWLWSGLEHLSSREFLAALIDLRRTPAGLIIAMALLADQKGGRDGFDRFALGLLLDLYPIEQRGAVHALAGHLQFAPIAPRRLCPHTGPRVKAGLLGLVLERRGG